MVKRDPGIGSAKGNLPSTLLLDSDVLPPFDITTRAAQLVSKASKADYLVSPTKYEAVAKRRFP